MARRWIHLSLGASLARRGPAVIVALIVSALTAVAAAVVGFVLARRGSTAPADAVPILASSALAWGGGFLHAFSASAGALRRDRADGIRQLFVARTTSLDGYLFGRVAGLALVLAIVIGGGTLLAGVGALAGATGGAGRTLQATMASVVFALLFAVVVAPVSLAALGARTRTAGWAMIVVVLFVPELVALSMRDVFPAEVRELVAIPSALGAVRTALAPDTFDLLRGLRALVVLVAFTAVATFFLRRDAVLLAHEDLA